MTPEQRSRCMSRIKGRDTKPEMMVRKFLFSKGLRYRVNVPTLPGKPDIVLAKYKTVIFIDGCFWHGHEGCRYSTIPKTNTDFWLTKITRNSARDHEVTVSLTALGWRVIRLWECTLKPQHREATLSHLLHTITDSPVSAPHTQSLPIHAPYSYSDTEPPLIAAEDSPSYSSD